MCVCGTLAALSAATHYFFLCFIATFVSLTLVATEVRRPKGPKGTAKRRNCSAKAPFVEKRSRKSRGGKPAEGV